MGTSVKRNLPQDLNLIDRVKERKLVNFTEDWDPHLISSRKGEMKENFPRP